MKLLKYIFYLTILPVIGFAQNWQKSYDLIPLNEFPNSDRGINIKKTQDGYVVLSGSLIDHNELSCFGLIKINENGEVQGKNHYTESNNVLRSFGYSTILVEDDNSIIVAGDRYLQNDEYEYFLTKIVDLDTVWFKTYTGDFMYYPRTLHKSRDGNYLIHGDGSGKFNGKTCTDITLLKTDTSGNELWRKTLGYHTVTRNNQYGNMIELANGNLVLTFVAQDYGFIQKYTHVAMLDSQGNTLWNKRYYRQQNGNPSIVQKKDGNLVFATNVDTIIPPSQSPFVTFLTTIDLNGDVLEEFYFNPEYIKQNSSLIVDKNGDIVICGLAGAFFWPVESAWIAKVSQEGVLLWERYFALKDKPYSFFTFLDIEELDNGFILSGDVVDTTIVGHNNVNVWVVKLDNNGCYDVNTCSEENILGIREIRELGGNIQISPNPSYGKVKVNFQDLNEEIDLKIFNSSGIQVIDLKKIESGQEVSLYQSGTYFFILNNNENKIFSKKIIITK